MRAVQTLVELEEEEANGRDSKLPAINAARVTRFHSSLRVAGRFFAANVLAPIVQRSPEPDATVCHGLELTAVQTVPSI